MDPTDGTTLDEMSVPDDVSVSGVEADNRGRLWFGDPKTGTLRAAQR